jgi:uncharacterized protein (DUF2147 family)
MCSNAGKPVGAKHQGAFLRRRIRLLALTTAVALAAPSASASATGLLGDWLTEDKDAALTIADCGGPLCGRIIWLESARSRGGSVRRDDNNPDRAKQRQRICGLVVIRGLKPTGPNTWGGEVYNPQDGRTYRGTITVVSDNALRLRAYIGLPIFGRSQTWTRVTEGVADSIKYNCGLAE